MLPTVSIAMAAYNGAKHIRRQLDSLAKQTHLPAEIVVTDDGSTDDTLAVVADFAKTAPFPVHAHRNPDRLNFRASFMKAANLCTSNFIAFCDQDDVWYPHKIAKCVYVLSHPRVDFVYHNADVVNATGEKIGSLDHIAHPAPRIEPLEFNPMDATPGFTQMFNRRLLEFSDLWPSSRDHRALTEEPMAHDQWFRFLSVCTGPSGYIHEPLAAYYQHGQNTFGAPPPQALVNAPFQNAAQPIARHIPYFIQRAEILEQIKSRLFDRRKDVASDAAAAYRHLAELHGVRVDIYKSKSILRRIHALFWLLGNGRYTYEWGFGLRSLVKDALIGVPAGPYLKN